MMGLFPDNQKTICRKADLGLTARLYYRIVEGVLSVMWITDEGIRVSRVCLREVKRDAGPNQQITFAG